MTIWILLESYDMTMWPAGHSWQVGELKDLLPDDFSAGDIKVQRDGSHVEFQTTHLHIFIDLWAPVDFHIDQKKSLLCF